MTGLSIFLKNRVTNSIVIHEVVSKEVTTIIKNLKEGSSRWDGVSASILKATCDSFIRPLTHVLNISITKGIFPNKLNVARVVPLFKSGDPMMFSNFDQFRFSLCFQKFWNASCVIGYCPLSTSTNYYTYAN